MPTDDHGSIEYMHVCTRVRTDQEPKRGRAGKFTLPTHTCTPQLSSLLCQQHPIMLPTSSLHAFRPSIRGSPRICSLPAALYRQQAGQYRAIASQSTFSWPSSSRRICPLPRASSLTSSRILHSSSARQNIKPQAGNVPHASIAAELAHPITPPAAAVSAGPDVLDRILPVWARGAKPYLQLIRIDKPIGSVLLFWPCGTSTFPLC